jgi:hypothetical protein
MAELHATYQNHGYDIQTLAVYGGLYDVLKTFSIPHVADVERLDLDAEGDTLCPDNHRFMEYSGGIAYFPDPKVTVKADYWVRGYGSEAMPADESAFTTRIGFIFQE